MGDAGAAGLVSALSASPDMAMSLIPGLLNHPSASRRIAAVQLLHDLGRPEALGRLVQLLEAPGESERLWAAALLTGLIRSRHAELKEHALVLPERVDRRIWPFEDYFPGRLAIPMIEALAAADRAAHPPVRNHCIEEAVKQLRIGYGRTKSKRQWENVARHVSLNSWRRRAARRLTFAAVSIVWLWAAFGLGLFGYCVLRQQTAIVHGWPPRILLAQDRSVLQLRAAARSLMAQIEVRYPPTVSGAARILPWKWHAEPSVPAAARETVGSVRDLGQGNRSPLVSHLGPIEPHLMALTVSPGAVGEFLDALRNVQQALPRLRSRAHVWLRTSVSGGGRVDALVALCCLAMSIPNWYMYRRMTECDRGQPVEETEWVFPAAMRFGQWTSLALLPYTAPTFIIASSPELQAALSVLVILSGVFYALERVALPRNPYMELIEQLQPVAGDETAGAAS